MIPAAKDCRALDDRESRKDIENRVFRDWLQAADNVPLRETIESALRAVLIEHCKALMYVVLRRNDPVLLEDAVNRVMLHLSTFKGKCLFTTWAHRVLLMEMYKFRRRERANRAMSIDALGFDVAGAEAIPATEMLLTVQQTLDDESLAIFEQIVIEGKTHREAAEYFELPKTILTEKWYKIQRTLRDVFAK